MYYGHSNPNKQSENPPSPPLFQASSVSIALVRNIATQGARPAISVLSISLHLVFVAAPIPAGWIWLVSARLLLVWQVSCAVPSSAGVILARHHGAYNIAARFLRSWNFGAKNIAARFRPAIISVLWISPGAFLIASQG